MQNLQNILKNQSGKISQKLLIIIALISTALLAIGLLISGKDEPTKADEHGHAETEEHAHSEAEKEEKGHAESEAEHAETIILTAKQMTEQGVQLVKAEMGTVTKSASYPAKITVNTDRQAHVSPAFSGHVEAVNVELGQHVQKGQALATLLVPDLVDQQANLQIVQTNLELARQDYERERQLWSQGISAKQDY